MTSARTLEDLFESYRTHGDLAAFEELYDRLLPELSMYCALRTGRRDRVGDVMNETWLELVTNPQRFETGRSFAAYAMGIARNKARQDLRRETRGGGEDRASTEPSSPRDTRGEVEAREIREVVEACIARIREPYAGVLRQHLIEGRSPLEIAVRLRTRPGTVGMRIARGLEQLRAVLPAGLAGAAVVGIGLDAAAQTRGSVLASARQRALARAALASGAGSAGGLSVAAMLKALGSAGPLPSALLPLLVLAVLALLWAGEPPSGDRLAWTNDAEVVRAGASEGSLASAEESPQPHRTDATGATAADEAAWNDERAAYVRVVLNGVKPDHLPGVVYQARLGWQQTIVPGTPQPDGSVLLDVRALLGLAAEAAANSDPGDDIGDQLGIRVAHPLYWGEFETVPWSNAREATSPDAAPSVLFVLHARAFLRGRIVLDGIDEAAELEALRVDVFDDRCESLGSWGYTGGTTIEGHELRVSVRESGNYRIEITSSASMMPHTIYAEAVVGSEGDLGTIQLVRGATIEGSVVAGVSMSSELGPIRVFARPLGPVWQSCDDGGGESIPRRKLEDIAIADDGSFRVSGLEPGRYALVLATYVVDGWVPQLAPPQVVDAPATGVVLGREMCLIDVQISDPFVPDPPSEASGLCPGCRTVHRLLEPRVSSTRRTKAPRITPTRLPGGAPAEDAAWLAQVPQAQAVNRVAALDKALLEFPSANYDVEIVGTPRVRLFLGRGRELRFFGSALSPRSFRAGEQALPCHIVDEIRCERPATEEETELLAQATQCSEARGTLRLRVSAADVALTRIELSARAYGEDSSRTSGASVVGGQAGFEFPPGRYEGEASISAESGAGLEGWSEGSMFVPCRFDFSVKAGMTTSVNVDFVLGGRIRVFAIGTLPSVEQVRLRVLSSDGLEVPIELEQMWDGDPTDGSELRSGEWFPSHSTRLRHALRAGRYRLEYGFVGDSEPARMIEFDVIAGRSTDVLVPFGE